MSSGFILNKVTVLDLTRNRLAEITISASSARGLHPNKEESKHIRNALRAIKLDDLREIDAVSFAGKLDEWTSMVQAALPSYKVKGDTLGWGYARKFVNLYLGEVSRSHEMRLNLPWLADVIKYFEVPLDENVGNGLRRISNCGNHGKVNGLQRWDTIKDLTPAYSGVCQSAAQHFANQIGANRVDLDLYLWRSEGKTCAFCTGAVATGPAM